MHTLRARVASAHRTPPVEEAVGTQKNGGPRGQASDRQGRAELTMFPALGPADSPAGPTSGR